MTNPSTRVYDSWSQRHARFLSALSLSFVFIALIIFFIDIPRLSIEGLSLYTSISLFNILIMLSIYIISKTAHYRIGIGVIIVYMSIATYMTFLGLLPAYTPDFGFILIAGVVLLVSFFFSNMSREVVVVIIAFIGVVIFSFSSLGDNPTTFLIRVSTVLIIIALGIMHSLVINQDRHEIISKSEQLRSEKEKLETLKLEEERYHTMLGHFLKNDLQRIINTLECLLLDEVPEKKLDLSFFETVLSIAEHSSKSINLVNRIFTILQSTFEEKKEIFPLLKLIREALAGSKIDTPQLFSSQVDQKSLDIKIRADKFLIDALREVFAFNPNGKFTIWGDHQQTQFCIFIQDKDSQPIPTYVCERLTSTISDNWEIQGLYLGLSLASVVLQYYSGYLEIIPGEDQGNIFQLCFPASLVQS